MPSLTSHDVISRLRRRLPRLGRTDDATATPENLGLDSMDTVELLCAIHEEFGVRITEAEFQPDTRLCELAGLIAEKSKQP